MPTTSDHGIADRWANGQERTHRFAATGRDTGGGACTVVVYRLTSVVRGRFVRTVVLAPDATERAAVVLPTTLAADLGQAIRYAAGVEIDPADDRT